MSRRQLGAITGGVILLLSSIALVRFATVPFRFIALSFAPQIGDPREPLLPLFAEAAWEAITATGFALGSLVVFLCQLGASRNMLHGNSIPIESAILAGLFVFAGGAIAFAAEFATLTPAEHSETT